MEEVGPGNELRGAKRKALVAEETERDTSLERRKRGSDLEGERKREGRGCTEKDGLNGHVRDQSVPLFSLPAGMYTTMKSP